MDKYMKIIRNIMFTMSGVKVEGPENWNRMCAAYQALEEMLRKMSAEQETKAE